MTPAIDVLVPVLRRPHRAGPFMDSLARSGVAATVWAIAEPGDRPTRRAWRLAGANVLVCPRPPGSFAQKCNDGFEHTAAPWVLLVGDDVRFHPGWLKAAMAYAHRGALVIGTQTAGTIPDGGTPHPVINRRYVIERGAGWDGPGVLCHEGYRHNFVDVEIALTAQDRGVWAYARDARIEHLHHIHGGKAPVDAVYELGASFLQQDRRHFDRRVRRFRRTAKVVSSGTRRPRRRV
jgi:hypothetical protein